MIQPTSIESYRAALEEGLISEKQQAVIEFLHKRGRATQGEINRHYQDTNRSYAPRFKELEDCGAIRCVGTVHDERTNRNVKEYELTGKIPSERARRKPTLTNKDITQLVIAVRTAANCIWHTNDGLVGGSAAVYELEHAMNILKRKGLA